MSLLRKTRKLITNPKGFWEDSSLNKSGKSLPVNSDSKTVAFAFKINHWKREFIEKNYPEYEWYFVPFKKNVIALDEKITKTKNKVFIIWGYNELDGTTEYAKKHNIPIYRMEDGFVRSVGLGANHELPISLVLDKTGTLYFDARSPSTLENILNEYDFSSNNELMKEAEVCLDKHLNSRISKYNHISKKFSEDIYSKYCEKINGVKRILVIGQVEEDASIKYGCNREINNRNLVLKARQDYPDAQIFFKPHPDTLAGKRDVITPLTEIAKMAHVVMEPLALIDSFETIDEVYTITSLSGLEAILRDIPVTTLGMPFYSGWGLTKDILENPRRKRKLSKLELFAAAYILYPDYFNEGESNSARLFNVIDEFSSHIMECNISDDSSKNKSGSVISQQFYCFGDNWGVKKDVPVAFVFGVLPWKRKYVAALLNDYRVAYRFGGHKYDKIEEAIQNNPLSEVFVWGYKENDKLKNIFKKYGKSIKRLEDGFVAGIGLGVDRNPSLSMCIDSEGLYYNSRVPSQLEKMLIDFDPDSNLELVERSKKCISRILNESVTKYNIQTQNQIELPANGKKRVLVLGQVETDKSIQFGCSRNITNNQLVLLAKTENPDAEIIYKPHPDVLSGKVLKLTKPDDVENIATVVYDSVSLPVMIDNVDHVYTITSLSGFEAVLRGKKVTTFGAPFYSGWGFTDDRQPVERRKRTLSPEQVFAVTYLLYSRYINPVTYERIELEQALDIIKFLKSTPHILTNTLPFKGTMSPYEIKKVEGDTKLYENAGDYKKALSLQKELILNDPVKIDYLKKFALICKKGDQNREGLQYLDQYLATSSDDAKAHYERSILLKRLGMIGADYEESLNKAINLGDINLKDKAIHALMDHSWYHKGQSPQSIGLIRKAMKNDVKQPIRLLKYAAILSQAGRPNEAVALYEKAVRLDLKYKNYCPFISLGTLMFNHDPKKYPKLKKCNIANDYLNKYKNKFIDELSENTYAVIGNSPCEIGKNSGAVIDDNRHVIRFNNFSTNLKFQKDYGKKTTMWVKPGGFFDEVKERSLDGIELVVIGKPDLEHCHTDAVDHILYFKEKGIPVCCVPRNIYNEAFSELEGIPSMGVLISNWIHHYLGRIPRNQIFGFSMTDQNDNKNSHYFKDSFKRDFYKHDWSKERKMLDSFLKAA